MHPTPRDAQQRFRDAPLRRAYCEAYCLGLTLIFHEDNNDTRKALTIAVVGVWAILELSSAFGHATLPDQFYFLRLVVGVLIGRMWGIEIQNFAGVEFSYGGDDGEE